MGDIETIDIDGRERVDYERLLKEIDAQDRALRRMGRMIVIFAAVEVLSGLFVVFFL